jgi:hypothetical protein
MTTKTNRLRSLSALVLFVMILTSTWTMAQVETDPSSNPNYDSNKRQRYTQLRERDSSNEAVEAQNESIERQSSPAEMTKATSACFIPIDVSYIALPRNDDGSFGPIALPFTFDLYGTSYTQCWINTNGNLTFTGPLSSFSASGFPFSIPMVAPFWGDVDTRNTQGGQIYYKLSATNLIVTWDNVGYYNQQVDKLNEFQVVISDGVDPITGLGQNVCFNYGDMQWTTGSASSGVNGFGGVPATVGVNKGNSVDFFQLGRFNQNNSAYDGPGGNPDGINYLDQNCYCSQVNSAVNIAPVANNFPQDTIQIDCGETYTLDFSFIPPEVNQTVSTTVNVNGACGTSFTSTSGSLSDINFSLIGQQCNEGLNTITFTATDNGTPVESTTVTLYVNVASCCNLTGSASAQGESCAGANDGQILFQSSGGTAPLQYSIDGGVTFGSSSLVSGLAPGTYVTVIEDANGCQSMPSTVTITGPSPLSASASSTAILCNGGTADVTVSATGGTAPYTGTGTFNVGAGTYTYTVTDANGCTETVSITVTEPSPLVISVTSPGVACIGGTVDVSVTASGGTAPYTGTGTFAVSAGAYTYTVSDANGCTASGDITVLEEDIDVQITGDPILCFGDTTEICGQIVTDELFFSEYVEGSSLNKCIEIYNGTGADIDLAAEGYTLDISFNGGSGSSSIALTGTIANGGTYVLCDDGAASAFLASADQTTTSSLWNGDDALTLSKSGVAVDIFGVIGNDPGSQWVSGANSTANSTLRRNGNVTAGVTTNPSGTGAGAFVTLESEWISTSNNDASGLGSHSININGTVAWSTGDTTNCISVSPTSTEDYTFTFTSSNGCTSTASYTVVVPTQLVASVSATSILCNGGTADVTVSATGGTAPYTGVGTFSETAGTYDYTVTDANGCSETVSITLTEPTPLVISVTSSGVACDGGTVDVTVSATGGTAPYTGTGTFAVSAGTYTYTVTDANGCSASDEITVTVEDLDVQIVGDPVLCFGDTVEICGEIITNELFFSEYVEGSSLNKCIEIYNGTGSDIDLAAEGYTLDISFNGGSGSSSIALTGTIANGGTYVLCDDGAASAFLASADQTTTSSLWNGDDALTLSKSGVAVDIFGVIGDDPGSQWVAGANSTANSTLRRNANVNVGITTNPSGTGSGAFVTLESEWISTSNNDASGLGSHSINTPGTIAWSTGDTTNCISVSPTSTEDYTFTFTSSNGCTSTASYTVAVPTQLVASVSATSIDCNGGTADVTVSATGGTAPYSGTGTFNVTAGTYDYTVTDANGCSETVSITVTEPTQLVLSISATEILCNGETTDITVSATGGTAPYTGTGTFTESAGTYSYTVSDANGCTEAISITVTEPTQLTASATSTEILCNGETTDITVVASGGTAPYTGTGVFTETAGTYTYTVTDSKGCTVDVTITVTEPPLLVAAATATEILCFGETTDITVTATGGSAPYTGTGTFTESAGTYTYTVTDSKGCTSDVTITVAEPPLLTASATATEILCNGETTDITVVASGGTPPYTGDGVYTELAGTYTYTVTDSKGCTADVTITVDEPTQLELDLSGCSLVYAGLGWDYACATIDGVASQGTPGYSYAWSTGEGTASITVCPDSTTTYSLTATDANGCSVTETWTVDVLDITCSTGGSSSNSGSGSSSGSGSGSSSNSGSGNSSAVSGPTYPSAPSCPSASSSSSGSNSGSGSGSGSGSYSGSGSGSSSGSSSSSGGCNLPNDGNSNCGGGSSSNSGSGSASNGNGPTKVLMCFNGMTYCVNAKNIDKKLACGYTLGPCDAQQSAACDNSVPTDSLAGANCVCSGRLTSISVRYIGPSGGTVDASAKSCGVPISSTSGLNTGDIFYVNAADGGLQYLRNTTYLEVAGSPNGQIAIPTNCCNNPVGQTFFPFQIIGWVDTQGNTCGVTNTPGGGGGGLDGMQTTIGAADRDSQFKVKKATISQYPNPATTNATFEFSVPESEMVTVSIVNIRGELIGTIFSNEVEAEQTYSVSHDISELQSGIYFVHLNTAEGTIKKKFVVLK